MEEFTSLLATHGLWVVAIAVLVDQFGIPIPAPPVLILAGGLIGTGELAAGPTLAVATLASLPADFTWFEIGRRRGRGVLRLLCRISLEPDSCVRSTSDSFSRRGPATLLFSKFVPGLQTLAPPLAGATGMSTLRFLSFAVPGAAIWAAAFLLAGALLADQIEQILTALAAVGGQLLLFLLIALAAWIGRKYWNRRQFLEALRTARIEPDTLYEIITRADGAEPPILFDLRNPEQVAADGARLPGAEHFQVAELDTRHQEIPRDREIILYCT